VPEFGYICTASTYTAIFDLVKKIMTPPTPVH